MEIRDGPIQPFTGGHRESEPARTRERAQKKMKDLVKGGTYNTNEGSAKQDIESTENFLNIKIFHQEIHQGSTLPQKVTRCFRNASAHLV